jgi:hypothetical protein
MGIDIGKNSFHVIGLDQRGAIVAHQRWTRSQIGVRLANLPPCLIGMDVVLPLILSHPAKKNQGRPARQSGS